MNAQIFESCNWTRMYTMLLANKFPFSKPWNPSGTIKSLSRRAPYGLATKPQPRSLTCTCRWRRCSADWTADKVRSPPGGDMLRSGDRERGGDLRLRGEDVRSTGESGMKGDPSLPESASVPSVAPSLDRELDVSASIMATWKRASRMMIAHTSNAIKKLTQI